MADRSEAEKQNMWDRAHEEARRGALATLVGATTLGGAIAGGYAGYRLGEAVSPDDFVGLGKALMYAVEGVPATIGATVGAGIGVFTGTWLIEGDFDTST